MCVRGGGMQGQTRARVNRATSAKKEERRIEATYVLCACGDLRKGKRAKRLYQPTVKVKEPRALARAGGEREQEGRAEKRGGACVRVTKCCRGGSDFVGDKKFWAHGRGKSPLSQGGC